MKKLALLLAGFAVISIAPAEASDWFAHRLSIGGGFGRAKPKWPDSYKAAYQDGDMWTAHLNYFLNNHLALGLSYADLEPYRRGNKQDFYRFRPIVAGLRYNILRSRFTPYLTAGAGYAINTHEAPGLNTQKWEDFTWQGGLGLEFFITEGTSLGAEALYHHFNGVDIDSFAPHRLLSAVGTVNIYFGAGPSKQGADQAKAEPAAAKNQTATSESASQANQAAGTSQQAAILAAAQAHVVQAQAEIDQVKQLVTSKQISPITFATGSADLNNSSNATLDKVADIAKKYPDLKLRVEGHTDNTGDADFNQELSQKRADAVRNYLINGGEPSGSISAVGFGQTRPIASNATPEGRTQNRRVEFIFSLP